jgi:hypothetical protein
MARLTPNQADRQNEARAAEAARQRAAAARQREAQANAEAARRAATLETERKRDAAMAARGPSVSTTPTSTTTRSQSPASSSPPAPPAPSAQLPSSQPVQSEPQSPPEPPAPPVYAGVKAAPIDTVVFVDEPYDEEFYSDVLFEDFGGQEILSVTRSDTVNGQDISYQPFKDLGIIRDQYSPNILLGIQETSNNFFANFLIPFNQKNPEVGNGPNGESVYFEEETGNVIIEFINIEDNEQIEIQILNAGIIEDIGI